MGLGAPASAEETNRATHLSPRSLSRNLRASLYILCVLTPLPTTTFLYKLVYMLPVGVQVVLKETRLERVKEYLIDKKDVNDEMYKELREFSP